MPENLILEAKESERNVTISDAREIRGKNDNEKIICSHVGKESVYEHRYLKLCQMLIFFSFGAIAHIWALAYLHETFRFTSVY
jgi:hypothetical protein